MPTKYKIENPDGSGYSLATLTLKEARNQVIGFSKMLDGEFCLYMENPLKKYRDPLHLGNWIYMGYAVNGYFYPEPKRR